VLCTSRSGSVRFWTNSAARSGRTIDMPGVSAPFRRANLESVRLAHSGHPEFFSARLTTVAFHTCEQVWQRHEHMTPDPRVSSAVRRPAPGLETSPRNSNARSGRRSARLRGAARRARESSPHPRESLLTRLRLMPDRDATSAGVSPSRKRAANFSRSSDFSGPRTEIAPTGQYCGYLPTILDGPARSQHSLER
jgi:hypothetical protein